MLGVGASKKTYVDELFSTQLWRGDAGTNRSINNGIDLSGEGGMVWFKRRNSSGGNHTVYDTVRTATKAIYPNDNGFGDTLTNGLKSFNSNGFTVGNHGNHNTSSNPYVAYSFRKAPGFFDVVTWTGNQTANRKISHSLGSVPGAIWIKRLGGSTGTNVSDWVCYNRGSDSEQYPQNFLQFLNRNVAASNDGAGNYLYNSAPTADEFTIGSHFTVNASGNDYIAYVFAHNDAQFGEGGDQSIIKCGYYSGNDSSNGTVVNLGWEPQWILIKRNNNSEDWMLFDTMRGIRSNLYDLDFRINDASAEADNRDWIDVNATGFQLKSPWAHVNASGSRYTYIAIRRPDGYVGKPADAGTDCFAMDTGNSSYTVPAFNSGFPVDFAFYRSPTTAHSWNTSTRFMDGKYLTTDGSHLEYAGSSFTFKSNDGFGDGGDSMPSGEMAWMWKRGKGFDTVAWTGNNASTRNLNHSMNNVPEMIWVKLRTSTSSYNWAVYHKDVVVSPNFYELVLNNNEKQTDSENFNGAFGAVPTSTQFTVKGGTMANGSNKTYIAMLFGSVDGISKVGSLTSPSSGNLTVTLGFQPRVVILKCTESNGTDWHIFDSLRGMVSGDYSSLKLNSSDDEETSTSTSEIYYIQQTSTGFIFNSDFWGEPNETFIYYAHA